MLKYTCAVTIKKTDTQSEPSEQKNTQIIAFPSLVKTN